MNEECSHLRKKFDPMKGAGAQVYMISKEAEARAGQWGARATGRGGELGEL